MKIMCRCIDALSEWSANIIKWIMLVQLIIINYEVVMRYVFNAPTMWSHVLSYLLGSSFVFLGLSYVWRRDSNVRIDMIYGKLSTRGKALVNNIFTLVVFFPMVFMITKEFAQNALYAYQINERVVFATWYPLLWPFKLAATIGFALLSLQGIATFIKNLVVIVKGNERRLLE